MEKALLSLKEVCEYTGWKETKVRELLKRETSTFTIRLGNRLYVNKKLFDDFLDKCAKYQICLWELNDDTVSKEVKKAGNFLS